MRRCDVDTWSKLSIAMIGLEQNSAEFPAEMTSGQNSKFKAVQKGLQNEFQSRFCLINQIL